jgi:hypothetical protein
MSAEMPKKFNLEAKIKAALRKLSLQWPAIGECRRRAKIATHQFKCEHCGEIVDRVEINHKESVIDPEDGFLSFDIYIARLFVPAEGLEAICKNCHKKVSDEERNKRVAARKSKKGRD